MGNLRSTDPNDLQDIGLYLQSLLQIMAVDGHLHETEQSKVRAYAERIGFEPRYVERTIADVLDNKHMPRTPPRFNSQATATEFLQTAIDLAICDGQIHPREKEWLLASARINGLPPSFVLEAIRDRLDA